MVERASSLLLEIARRQPSSKSRMTDDQEPPDEAESRSPPWAPATEADKELIREQLGRILSSALFRNSKRFPAFLRFTVEHALAGSGTLKERTIGHEVFGRDPSYDTSQDPVVRMTAAEVRKRLTQYYQAPEHVAETVIAFQAGSYVPEFFPAPAPAVEAPAAALVTGGTSGRTRRRWVVASVAAAGILALLVLTGRWPGSGTDAASRFWSPLLKSSAAVLICIGDPSPALAADADAKPSPDDLTIQEFLRGSSVRYTDSVTLALVAGELASKGKPFRIRRPAATELKDLRDGPVLLIGGFNNPWTLRLTEGLRFQLASDERGNYIRDRQRPEHQEWRAGDASRLLKRVTNTYGLITRMQDPATGHAVLTVSGLVLGTKAAAECLINVDCLDSVERLQPNLDHRNVQIVVSAAVIGEDSGAPSVVAVHSW